MDETFEIKAIRLAELVASGPRKGWLNDAKTLAGSLLSMTTKTVIVPLTVNAPKPKAREQITVHIRWMIRRDMPEVLEIEGHSFDNPWSEENFIWLLRKRNAIGMVAEFDERVVGFMCYTLHQTRLELENLAVHTDFRWKGVGRQMVAKLAGKISPQRRSQIRVMVRETNLHAQLFFCGVGLKAVGTLRDYYEDTDDEAIVMTFNCADIPQQIPGTGCEHR